MFLARSAGSRKNEKGEREKKGREEGGGEGKPI